ncbi:hypothetical protein LLG46_08925 [bacterium]|nr:hypothetical protein [bacterium]
MTVLTKEKIKEFAYSHGLDLVGVANIERFDGAPARMHPASIFPEARSVIVVGKRIIHGGWRGIEEGTYWASYSTFDYCGLLNMQFIQIPLYDLACLIEDHGWEAVPYYSGASEIQQDIPPLREGGVPPNVHLAIRIAAVAAGLGEIGWSKALLTKKYGPRVRVHAIITDMPLEPDPLVEPGSICTRCMQCVKGCPGAIPHIKEGKSVKVTIEDKTYEWGDVDMGKCTLIYHGGDSRVSPFIHKSFPGWNMDVTAQEMSEEAAYKFCWPMSTGAWRASSEFPSGYIIEGHAMLQRWGDMVSYGIGASRGCMRSCFNYLEKHGLVEQTFKDGDFIKRPRWLLPSKVEKKT